MSLFGFMLVSMAVLAPIMGVLLLVLHDLEELPKWMIVASCVITGLGGGALIYMMVTGYPK